MVTVPEISLPDGRKSDEFDKNPSSPILDGEKERIDEHDCNSLSPKVVVDEKSPIIHHYLEFSTLLPHPAFSSSIERPPAPNLKKYTSPFEWSYSRKTFTLAISCIATMVAGYTAGAYAPPAAHMAAEWNVSQVAVLVGITTFCSGFAIAPMVLAPFSEINGRYPVFVGAGVLFFVSQLCCALTRTYYGMLIARFFSGCGSSVFSTMVGGVISDMYHAKDRNTPMALFAGGALFGTGLGPLVSGFLTQNLAWRWVFWVQVITCGLLVTTVTLFVKETRGSILLSRKAAALNTYYTSLEAAGHYGLLLSPNTQPIRLRYLVRADEERESISKMITISIYRPFHLLFTEPVVFFFSLWVSFAWAVLYLTFSSIPLVFTTAYGFEIQESSAVFAAMMVGATLSTVLSIYQDRFLASYLVYSGKEPEKQSRFMKSLDLSCPEGRLYFACLGSVLLPIGLFWFGYSQGPSVHWVVPSLSITCATMGIYSVYLATFNYLADTYHRYASSALAAQSFCRNMLGGIFPLVAGAMFHRLGIEGATSLLGGLGVLLTVVPWVLVLYGPRIRARSKFASEIM